MQGCDCRDSEQNLYTSILGSILVYCLIHLNCRHSYTNVVMMGRSKEGFVTKDSRIGVR